MKQKEMARWLKVILITAAFLGAVLCIFILPSLGNDMTMTYPEAKYMYFPCLLFFWISAIPFYAALGMSWMICTEIIRDNSFSDKNASLLRGISRLAFFDGLYFFAGIVILGFMNLLNPGILLGAVFLIFLSISFAVAAAALSHLVKNASDMKLENDLTV